jgi:alcohol dehydrogenase class IV
MGICHAMAAPLCGILAINHQESTGASNELLMTELMNYLFDRIWVSDIKKISTVS